MLLGYHLDTRWQSFHCSGFTELMGIFLRNSVVALAYALNHCPTERPTHVAFSTPWLSEGDSYPRFFHLSLCAMQSSCSLGTKTSLEHNASTTIDAGDGVHGRHSQPSLYSKHNQWIDAKQVNFGLIQPHYILTSPTTIVHAFLSKQV